MQVLVIGQSSFLGKSFISYAQEYRKDYNFIPFERKDLINATRLDYCVRSSDVIILLSAICRGFTDLEIYNSNISIVRLLIESLERTSYRGRVIFPSSIQENDISGYGKSKLEGRKLLSNWCKNNDCAFLGLILPNIFGPGAKPNYASFIATFCHLLKSGESPQILCDNLVNLLYIKEFIMRLFLLIDNRISQDKFLLTPSFQYRVSEVLERLKYFDRCRLTNKSVDFHCDFDVYLYNTYKSY